MEWPLEKRTRKVIYMLIAFGMSTSPYAGRRGTTFGTSSAGWKRGAPTCGGRIHLEVFEIGSGALNSRAPGR